MTATARAAFPAQRQQSVSMLARSRKGPFLAPAPTTESACRSMMKPALAWAEGPICSPSLRKAPDNTIEGRQFGNSNQAAVSQVGRGNGTYFSQGRPVQRDRCKAVKNLPGGTCRRLARNLPPSGMEPMAATVWKRPAGRKWTTPALGTREGCRFSSDQKWWRGPSPSLRRVKMSKTLALTSALALILASGSAFAADNYANSTQTGDSNSSQITQNSQQGHGHHATSDVTGDHNTVGIDQTSTTDGLRLGFRKGRRLCRPRRLQLRRCRPVKLPGKRQQSAEGQHRRLW